MAELTPPRTIVDRNRDREFEVAEINIPAINVLELQHLEQPSQRILMQQLWVYHA
jgi:hypothetical protein